MRLGTLRPAERCERIGALEPDLIGEHHVATVADAELIDGCLSWIEAEPAETREKRRRDLLTVLQRATQPEHGATAEPSGSRCSIISSAAMRRRLPATWSRS